MNVEKKSVRFAVSWVAWGINSFGSRILQHFRPKLADVFSFRKNWKAGWHSVRAGNKTPSPCKDSDSKIIQRGKTCFEFGKFCHEESMKVLLYFLISYACGWGLPNLGGTVIFVHSMLLSAITALGCIKVTYLLYHNLHNMSKKKCRIHWQNTTKYIRNKGFITNTLDFMFVLLYNSH